MSKRIINPSFKYKSNKITMINNSTNYVDKSDETIQIETKKQLFDSNKILFKVSLIVAIIGGLIMNWNFFQDEGTLLGNTFPIGNICAFILAFVFFWFGVITMLVPVSVVELFFGKESLQSNDKLALSFLIFGGVLGFILISERLGFAF